MESYDWDQQHLVNCEEEDKNEECNIEVKTTGSFFIVNEALAPATVLVFNCKHHSGTVNKSSPSPKDKSKDVVRSGDLLNLPSSGLSIVSGS